MAIHRRHRSGGDVEVDGGWGTPMRGEEQAIESSWEALDKYDQAGNSSLANLNC